MKPVLFIAALIAMVTLAHASTLTGGNCNGWGLTALTGSSVCGTAPSPPVCNPGTATGEMDFSVCSNIGITAAVW